MLKACPVQKRLLLLDVMQPFADARAGVLVGDAAARTQPILDEALKADPTLMVLCACSPGQTSLASEEMGHTVFVHYLIEGLSGKADGWGADGTKDSRVSVRELAAFTAANVDRWAWHNRAVHQTPVLRGGDADFLLTVADAGPVPADAPLEKDYPKDLKAAWSFATAGWPTPGSGRRRSCIASWRAPPCAPRTSGKRASRRRRRWRT